MGFCPPPPPRQAQGKGQHRLIWAQRRDLDLRYYEYTSNLAKKPYLTIWQLIRLLLVYSPVQCSEYPDKSRVGWGRFYYPGYPRVPLRSQVDFMVISKLYASSPWFIPHLLSLSPWACRILSPTMNNASGYELAWYQTAVIDHLVFV